MPSEIDPLDVLDGLMCHSESEQIQLAAAKTLAEYKHMKLQPDAVNAKQVNFNVTLEAPEKPLSLPTKVPTGRVTDDNDNA